MGIIQFTTNKCKNGYQTYFRIKRDGVKSNITNF